MVTLILPKKKRLIKMLSFTFEGQFRYYTYLCLITDRSISYRKINLPIGGFYQVEPEPDCFQGTAGVPPWTGILLPYANVILVLNIRGFKIYYYVRARRCSSGLQKSCLWQKKEKSPTGSHRNCLVFLEKYILHGRSLVD